MTIIENHKCKKENNKPILLDFLKKNKNKIDKVNINKYINMILYDINRNNILKLIKKKYIRLYPNIIPQQIRKKINLNWFLVICFYKTDYKKSV